MFWKNKTIKDVEPQEVKALEPKPEERKAEEIPVGNNYSKVHSALGSGTVISGKLSFDSPVRLDGRLSGEVHSTDCLIIGETAVVDADLSARELIVMGSFSGKASVREKTELKSGCQFQGKLRTGTLVMSEAAILNADCQMSDALPIELSNKLKKSK